VRLGVLDVGSNTVHLLVVDAHHGAAPLPAHSHKTDMRLAEHIVEGERISAKGVDTLVSFVGAEETWLFVEAGTLNLVERDGAGARIVLKGGESYSRAAGAAKGSVSPRPSPAQSQRVPRSFRDTLPHRAAAFKDRKVEPKALPPPSVADLADWLAAEPTLRKEFPRRFTARAQDAAFRTELIRQFGDHPEWVPVLYPERVKKP